MPGAYRKEGKHMVVSASLEMWIFGRDGFTCQYCHWHGLYVYLVADHDIPVSRGGTDVPWNLVTACRGCNWQKGDMTGAEYRSWRMVHPHLANFGP
jgi:5-methylcytosine-specific restriction endonuclease McrA